MAAFRRAPISAVTLVRNHEENCSAPSGARGGGGTPVYDTAALGGTSTVHVSLDGIVDHSVHESGRHPDELLRRHDAVGIVGHLRGDGQRLRRRRRLQPQLDHNPPVNRPCRPAPTRSSTSRTRGLQKTHGFIFEVPADGEATAQPIKNAGRFAHESVAWDPKGGSLYLSEDNFAFPSGFYRTTRRAPDDDGRACGRGTVVDAQGDGRRQRRPRQEAARRSHLRRRMGEDRHPSFDFGRPAGPDAEH